MKTSPPQPPNAQHYSWAIHALWMSANVLAAMPLQEMRSAQLEAIAKVKLDDPAAFAEKGQAIEDDAELTRIVLSAVKELRERFPALNAIKPRWPTLPTPASRPS